MQTFFATAAKGLEEVLSAELTQFGATCTEIVRAGVSFTGTLSTAYRACLWSRVASRVLLPLRSFDASNPEKLYGGVKQIRWSDHISPDATLAVDFSTSQSEITHSHFGALKTKDAIVDQLRSIHGTRPSVDTASPDVRVNVYLHQNQAHVSIDLSGEALHRRGYRDENVPAPMKENLAAGILLLAEWPRIAGEGGAFIDPMCGSGTLPIEAALMAADIAPGILRDRFGFEGWLGHDRALWRQLRDEASERKVAGLAKLPKIVGFDRDLHATRSAISHVENAGLRGAVHIEKREVSELQPVGLSGKGLVVINPPYGERLGDIEELKPLYGEIGDIFKQRFKGWMGYILTGSPDLAKVVGLKASRRIVLFNGAIECRLLKYDLY